MQISMGLQLKSMAGSEHTRPRFGESDRYVIAGTGAEAVNMSSPPTRSGACDLEM